jgi:tripartite-type tricarboxylate transporter receptor subunit TctC
MVSIVPLLLVVHPSLPAYTAKEFIALAKARPGQVTMASAGTGSNTHLTGELFQVITGVKLTHVPYKGSGPALIDLIGGQTQCIFDQVSTSAPHVKTGKLRALAVAAAKRSATLADVVTMQEAGVRNFEAETYTGIFLPSAAPKDIVQRVYAALTKVLDLPATRDAFNRWVPKWSRVRRKNCQSACAPTSRSGRKCSSKQALNSTSFLSRSKEPTWPKHFLWYPTRRSRTWRS